MKQWSEELGGTVGILCILISRSLTSEHVIEQCYHWHLALVYIVHMLYHHYVTHFT